MTIERYPRSARRYHAAIYIVTLLLLATGWWLLTGREGAPSPLALFTGIPDTKLHVWFGWALVIAALAPLPFFVRGVVAFVRESLRRDRGDLTWLMDLPRAALSGRFRRRHEGHFDPGQRIANVVIVTLLAALVTTGVGMVLVTSGPLFAMLTLIHRLSTIVFTVVIAGHILIALGVLPGYRGVWRSMHIGGRLPIDVARRIWPGWTERTTASTGAESGRTTGDPKSGLRRRSRPRLARD